MVKYIIHKRTFYSANTTIGEISLFHKQFCYTLEDTVRADGIKVYGGTAIPANRDGYNVTIRHSNSFKRNVLVLDTEGDSKTIKKNDIKFEYIYAHAGNRHRDSKGCILVAYNKNEAKDVIYSSAEKGLFSVVEKWLEEGHTVKWIITNEKQEG